MKIFTTVRKTLLLLLCAGVSFAWAQSPVTVTQTFTLPYSYVSATAATYTFSLPAGVTSFTAQCWGAGGAGGSANYTTYQYSAGGGGGGGAYATATTTSGTVLVSGATVTVSVGWGGEPNASTNPFNGGSGLASYVTIGSTTIADAPGGAGGGGGGGTNEAGGGGLGGGQTGNTTGGVGITELGGNGGAGTYKASTGSYEDGGSGGGGAGSAAGGGNGASTSNSATAPAGGTAGTSPAGAGATGTSSKNVAAGNYVFGSNGATVGGGGSGGVSNRYTGVAGGYGGNGQVIITYTYTPSGTTFNAPNVTITNNLSTIFTGITFPNFAAYSATFALPAGVTSFSSNCWGAGGGGGGCSATAAVYLASGGGGGGAYATGSSTSSSVLTSGSTVTVVAGGGGTSSLSGGTGQAGGSSYVTIGSTTIADAPGGLGGVGAAGASNLASAGGLGGGQAGNTTGAVGVTELGGNGGAGTIHAANATYNDGGAGGGGAGSAAGGGTGGSLSNSSTAPVGGTAGTSPAGAGGTGCATLNNTSTGNYASGTPGATVGGGGGGAATYAYGGVVGAEGGDGQVSLTYVVATLTTSTSTLTTFPTTCLGVASSPESFTISGTGLVAGTAINLAAVSGYSYSTSSGGPYTSTLSLPDAAGGTYGPTTVYVEFTPTIATTYSGNIAISCSPAASVNVAVSGTGQGCGSPTLSASSLSSFGTVCVGNTTGPNSFTITGTSLNGGAGNNVTVSSLTDFTFSTSSGGPYTSNLSLSQSGGSYSQIIYVQLTPSSVTTYTGENIVIGGGGASNYNESVTGTSIGVPSITLGSNPAVCASSSVQTANLPYSADPNSSTYSISGWSGGSFSNVVNASMPASSPIGITVPANTTANTYTANLTVSNAGCSSSAYPISVLVNSVPSAVTVTPSSSNFCGTQMLNASGGAGGIIYYQGTTSNGTSIATAATSETVSASGTYYFNSISSAGCPGPQGSSTVNAGLSGTYTIPGSFSTLNAAVAAYNAAPVCGPVVFQLTSSYSSSSEIFPITINQNANASSTNTLVIEPQTGPVTITGSTASSALLQIFGNWVTVNGSPGGTGATQDLTIQNTNTGASVIWIGSSGTTPIANSTVENCFILNGTQNTCAIFICDGTTMGAAGYSNNITIQNNNIQTAYDGIYAIATATGTNGNGLLITGNQLNASGANSIDNIGLFIDGYYGATISNNTIGNFIGSVDDAQIGILLYTGTTNSTVSGNTITAINNTVTSGSYYANPTGIFAYPGTATAALTISNNTISNLSTAYQTGAGNVASGIMVGGGAAAGGISIYDNNISNIKTTLSGAGACGILLNSTTLNSGINVYNNFVSNIVSYGTTTLNYYEDPSGIVIGSGGGYNLYFNSVYIGTGACSNHAGYSSCLWIQSLTAGYTGLNVENNIFQNAESAPSGGAYFDIYGTGGSGNFTTLNYNDYVDAASTTQVNYFNGTWYSYATTASTYMGTANYSINGAPTFVNSSTGNLDLVTTGGVNGFLEAGVNGTGITTDIVGTTRYTSPPPTMGAFQIPSVPYDAGATAVITPSPFCPGTSTIQATIENFGNTTLTSVNVLWRVNGVLQGVVSPTINLATGASTTITLGTYNFSDGIPYTIEDSTYLPDGNVDENNSNDATSIVAYAGMPGTVYIGTGSGTPAFATYSSLFSTINSSSIEKNLYVYVQSSTTEPTTPTFLNATSICSGTDTIFIQPAAAIACTASGSTGSSSYPGLIGFNGASNVIINGSYGGGRYLAFTQTNASYSDMVFQNNSNNIIVENCGFGTGATSNTAPLISLGTSSAAGTGNSNITINSNVIGSVNGITYWSPADIASNYTNAASSSVNSNNTISNNNIYNFAAQSGGMGYGIDVTGTGNGGNWTITGNSIYNSASNTVGAQTGIYFQPGSSASGNSISNNYIGGSSANCGTGGTAVYWENDYGVCDGTTAQDELDVISLNCGTVTISGNTIERINSQFGANNGIVVINIFGSTSATITGNTIGNPDGIQNDNIWSNGGANSNCGGYPGYIVGIQSVTSGTLNISSNNIYYLAQLGTYTAGYMEGIIHTGSGVATITNNVLAGLQACGYGTYGSAYNSFAIFLDPSTANSGNVISGNVIDGPYIINAVTGQPANEAITVEAGSGTISDNTIYNMLNEAYGTTLGIAMFYTANQGNWLVSNNQIALGNTTPGGTAYTNWCAYFGIYDGLESNSTTNFLFNSVYIYGSQSGTYNYPSYSYYREPGSSGTVAGDVTSVKDNIFINYRTGGTASVHEAIANYGTSSYSTGFTSNYNFLTVNPTGYETSSSALGEWGTSYYATLNNWNSASSQDGTSQTGTLNATSSSTLCNPAQLFTNYPYGVLDINLAPATAPWPFSFVTGEGLSMAPTVTTDIHGNTRSTLTVPYGPTIGVDEVLASCNGTPAVATASASPAVLCGTSSSSSLSLTGLTPSVGYTYQWYTSTSSSTGPWSTASGASTSVGYTTPALANTSWYYCRVYCTNSLDSTNSTVVQVTVVPNTLAATINSVAGPVNVCIGTPVSLAATGATSYSWTSSPSGFTSSSATASATPTVTTAYTVAGTTSGCTFNATVTADILSVTAVAATSPINLGGSTGITATATYNSGTVTYGWSPCSSLSASTGSSVTATPPASTTYTVIAFDANGCTASGTAVVNVIDPTISAPPTTVATGYTGANVGSISFSDITPATVLQTGNITNTNYTSNNIGFNFDFNGTIYTSFGLNTNGYIWFDGTAGAAPAATTTNPISNASADLGGSGTINGIISALGSPINANYDNPAAANGYSIATPSIGYSLTGTAPNRQLTIQWAGYSPISSFGECASFGFTNNNRVDFQIVLNEHGGTNSDVIQLNYSNEGPECIDVGWSGQIGLRGTSNSDFANRTATNGNWSTSSAGGANTSTCSTTGGTWVRGVAFKFTPASCSTNSTITTSGSPNLCPGGSVNLTAAAGSSYSWYLNDVLLGSTSQTLTGVTTPGNYVAVPVIGACSEPSYIVAVTNNANETPSVTIASNPATPLCSVSNATFTATPVNPGCVPIYQWQLNGNAVTGIPANSATYTDNSLNPGDQVDVIMTSDVLCSTANPVTSNTITNNALPTVFNVTGGTNCASSDVGLSNSTSGVSYQLYVGASAVGSPLAGNTGNALDFGVQTTAGVYTIVATNTATSCQSTMSGSSTVNSNPNVYAVDGGTNCGATTVSIPSSDANVGYQLYYDGSPVAGSVQYGDGFTGRTWGSQATVGTYTVVATVVASGCSLPMSGSAIVEANPNVYTVGGGNNCTSSDVTLSNSDNGINYQLYNGASAVGTALAGTTGQSLDFGVQTAIGTYTVEATNATTGCTSAMSGSSSVYGTPTLYNVTGGTNCGATTVGINLTDANVLYQLWYNGSPVAGTIQTGATPIPRTWGSQTGVGTYTIVATVAATSCSATMNGSATVLVNPNVYTVGGGINCGSSDVTLSGSDNGINYQLYNGASTVGTAVAGTSHSLDFGSQTAAGTYTVVATDATTGCTSSMTGSSSVYSNPNIYTVTGGTNCGSTTVGLSGSDVGASYQLYNGVNPVGSAINGDGTPRTFGSQTAVGTYTVVATIGATSCTANMTGSAVVEANPTVYTVGGGTNCSSSDVTLSNSDIGINYQLYNGVNTVGTAVAGTSHSLDFGSQTAAGTYTVVATNATTGCTSNMSGSSSVYSTPTIYAVTGGTNCGAATIGLSGTDVGVSYQLYNGVNPVGSPVNGDGTPRNFGSQSATGTYTVIATIGATSCVANMSGSATINPTVGASASNTGPYINGQTIQLNSGGIGGDGSFTYSWSGPSYSSGSQNPSIASATSANAGTYVVTVTDGNECSATASTDVVVGSAVYTWTGTTNTNWTVTTNWSPPSPIGGPNGCSADIIIPVTSNQPVLPVATPVSVGNVQINSNVQLTLNSNLSVCKNWTGGSSGNAEVIGGGIVVLNGSTLQTISGSTGFNELLLDNTSNASMQISSNVSIMTALDLHAGNFDATNGTLTFLSTSVTQVGIIDNFSAGYQGTLTGNINAERYYLASNTYNQHFMGSPVNTPSLAQFGATGSSGYVIPKGDCDESQMASGSPYGTVFSYHEAHGSTGGCGLAQWFVESSGVANNAQGYSLLKYNDGVLTVNGTANLNSSYTVSGLTNSNWQNTSLQNRVMSSGWQLVSNPYLATLQISATNGGFDNQVQVWNANGQYSGTYQAFIVNDDAVIPPFQGFMVHMTNPGAGGTYTINGSDRVRVAQTFYAQNDNQLVIVAQNITTGLLDQTMIAFNSHATDNFDPQYDANKLGGSLNRHTLYSLNNNKWMARNVLNSVNTTSTVPVGFEPGATGTYALAFNKLNTFDPTTYIFLEDKQTGAMYNVRNGDYQFSADSADEWNRFVIHFTPPAQILANKATCTTKGSISIVQPGPANWNYIISDENNQTIASGVLNQSTPINIEVEAGNYNLKLVDENDYTVTKVIAVGGAPVTTASFNAPTTASSQTGVSFTSTSQNATDYTWYFSNGTIITGIANPTYTFTEPGTYTVMLEVTNSAGCTSSITKTITVSEPTGVSNISANGDINMWSYENRVYVDFTAVDKVDAVINIYNILGQQISNEKFTNKLVYQKEIDDIAAAYVIVSVINDDKTITRKLFIINPK